jgi:hypothetical protein
MTMTKITGSGSGSISQRHGSADPDPDPHQYVIDLEHWLKYDYSCDKVFEGFPNSAASVCGVIPVAGGGGVKSGSVFLHNIIIIL